MRITYTSEQDPLPSRMGISRKSPCSYLCERAKQEVREGELFLHLEVDGVPIYVLQFSIVPGSVAGLEAGNVFLISRIQGVKGGYDQVRAATKALGDVAPPALLVVVLQGIARAFAIEGLAGVSATSQFSYTQMCADSFNGAYNDFFIELGTTHSTAKFFTSPLPIEEKPVDYIKNGHKARTRRKRAFRLEIASVYIGQFATAISYASQLGNASGAGRAQARPEAN